MIRLLLFGLLFMACNDSTTTTTETATGVEQGEDLANDTSRTPSPSPDTSPRPSPSPTPVPAPAPGDLCYRRITGRDSLTLSYSVSGNTITGKMLYDNYQKDGSFGTVKGTIHGDTLKVWYNFQSEGMNSVRRIIYKMDGDKLSPGTGEFMIRGDSSLYADEKKIVFGKEGALKKVDCGVLRFTF